MTPHYRLGVGINSAVAGSAEVTGLMTGSLSVAQYNAAVQARTQALVEKELHAMFFEAYCNGAVFKGGTSSGAQRWSQPCGRFDAAVHDKTNRCACQGLESA